MNFNNYNTSEYNNEKNRKLFQSYLLPERK